MRPGRRRGPRPPQPASARPTPPSPIGESVPRRDGVAKVTGAARFTSDLSVPGMAWAKVLRSPYPHARIRSIDAAAARALPGVVAVVSAADLGRRRASTTATPWPIIP